jgi:hypothetical protein
MTLHTTGILLLFLGAGLIFWAILTTMFLDPIGIIMIVIGAKIMILTIIFQDRIRLDKR